MLQLDGNRKAETETVTVTVTETETEARGRGKRQEAEAKEVRADTDGKDVDHRRSCLNQRRALESHSPNIIVQSPHMIR